MKNRARSLSVLALVLSFVLGWPGGIARADDHKSIILQSTTSTANSGLYDFLLPMFFKATGINVRVVAVGTGQAIRNARRCDADVLLVHARSSEEQFVSDGFGVERFDLMYNDFVIIGAPEDAARVDGLSNIVDAFKKIASTESNFISRGDDSGTHQKEQSLWSLLGYDPAPASGTWYRETGQGMGATLNIGAEMEAYVMTDRATWIAFRNKADLRILVQGDERLFNQYGVIKVNPEKCPNVKSDLADQFIQWMIADVGQRAIEQYRLAGKQVFFPNAN